MVGALFKEDRRRGWWKLGVVAVAGAIIGAVGVQMLQV